MAIEKVTVWIVDGVKYNTEDEAKKAELRKIHKEIADIVGRVPCNEEDVDEATTMILEKIRDIRGLSKVKLQKIIDARV